VFNPRSWHIFCFPLVTCKMDEHSQPDYTAVLYMGHLWKLGVLIKHANFAKKINLSRLTT
jgi:hypothetical protein